MALYPTYGGAFKEQAELILSGNCHFMCLGDSQTVISRTYGHVSHGILAYLPIRWNYVYFTQGGTTGYGYGFSSPPTDAAAGATSTTYGLTLPTDVNSGSGTPNLGAISVKLAFTSNSASANWTYGLGGGWQLVRIQSSTSSSGQAFSWPLLPSLGSKPWYHGAHCKASLLIQGQAANSITSFGQGIRRYGISNTSDTGTFADVTVAETATIQAMSWTSAKADAGNYATSVSTAGTLNDHGIAVEARPGTGFDETNKSIIFLGVTIARCSSDGTITWNNTDGRNSGAGFASIGRSGSGIEEWTNSYWTQTQWQEFFTATVLVPNKVTVLKIMLGHNLNASLYSGNVPNATHLARWSSFLTTLRAAYAAAFPVGTYPYAKLHLMICVPWLHTAAANGFDNTTRATALQAHYETTAASFSSSSWFSFYNAYDRAVPFDSLHAESDPSCQKLSQTFMNALHQATSFAYYPVTTNTRPSGTIASRRR